jgi:hypothetical protein
MLTQASTVHIDVASMIYSISPAPYREILTIIKQKGLDPLSIHEVTTLMEETIMIRTK